METTEGPLVVDGIEFISGWVGRSEPERFVILKEGVLRQAYIDLLASAAGQRIMELGIYLGGSAALAALVARPSKLVVVDILPPVEALDRFIESRGLTEVLRPHYETDQSDRACIERIVRDEFGDEPIDLVIDDASHLFEETCASFEAIFPFLAPRGRFVIEDWRLNPLAVAALRDLLEDGEAFEEALQSRGMGWLLVTGADPDSVLHWSLTTVVQQALEQGGDEATRARRAIEAFDWTMEVRPARPLASLTVDLVAVAGARPDVISRLEIRGHWVIVERGPATLPTSGWHLLERPGETEHLLGIGPLEPA